MGIRQEVAFKNNSEVFKRLAQIANVATLTPEERYHYEADVKNARDTLNQIRTAYKDGREEGREEKALEVARNLKRLGANISMIAQATGLSPDLIANL